jgi:hypothetical protein
MKEIIIRKISEDSNYYSVSYLKNPVILAKDISKKASCFKDLTGLKINRLYVLEWFGSEVVSNKGNKKSLWLCICDCGNKVIYRGADLQNKVKSCGCYNSEKTIIFNKATKSKESYSAFSDVWQTYRLGAIKRGYSFNLTKDQFREITTKNCFYCGEKPSMSRKFRGKMKIPSYVYNGIDRLNNDIGYELSNCVPCCSFCNYSKKSMTKEAFLNKIKQIFEFNFK